MDHMLRDGEVSMPCTRGVALLSIVTPAFREERNLPELYARLVPIAERLGVNWEWIVVDDHSPDGTYAVIARLAASDPRVRGLRLARNSGSHTALLCGLQQARGDCAVVLAADLQDPPETIDALLHKWREGAQVVWAVRATRQGESAVSLACSRLYYVLMRRVIGMQEMPAAGADFFLADRRVIDALRDFREANVSILALLTWMGFRQAHIAYDKQARLHGQSGWSLRKKLKLVVDSVASFSYLPLRLMSLMGVLTAGAGFSYAVFVIANALAGQPIMGWSSLMVVVLVLGGMQMLMLGVLGEYLWRALDESRRRPRFLIEAETSAGGEARASSGEADL